MSGTDSNSLQAFAEKSTESGCFQWMWLGQGSFAYKFGKKTVLVDPYLSDAITDLARSYPRILKPCDAAGNYILTTHDHPDHFDPETICYAVLSEGMTIIGPHSCLMHYCRLELPAGNFIELNSGETTDPDGMRIIAIRAEHPYGDGIDDAVGYLIEYEDLLLYHIGDSEYTEELAKRTCGLEPDYLIVPINGRWGNMNAAEAALLAGSTKAKTVIPMHYDLFVENTADPMEFVRQAGKLKLPCRIIIPEFMKTNIEGI